MKTHATVDISGFNRGMQGFVRKLGLEAQVVLRKEMGELVKTLVRTTPPKRQSETNKKIAGNLAGKFEEASHADYIDSRISPGGVKWLGHNKGFLYGVANELDLRTESDVRKIATLAKSLTRKGRLILPFKHPHKRQMVNMSRRVFLQAGMAGRTVKYVQKHTGRLKAGWLAAVFGGAITLTGANQPPQWVTRHRFGVRGYFINGLGVKDFPRFTIANTAAGVGNPKNNLDSIVRAALNIRAKAMQKNLLLFMSGKKKITDYK